MKNPPESYLNLRPSPVQYPLPPTERRRAIQHPRAEADDSVLEVLCIIRILQTNKPFDLNAAAARLDKLSLTLTDIGAYDVACEISAVSVKTFRRLGPCHPHLATVLHNYSNHLSAVGRWQDALAASEDPVDIFAELSRLEHLKHGAESAMALVTNSNCLIVEEGSRSHRKAVYQARKACGIYQQLISHEKQNRSSHGSSFESDLAVSLTAYTTALLEVGRVRSFEKIKGYFCRVFISGRLQLICSRSRQNIPHRSLSIHPALSPPRNTVPLYLLQKNQWKFDVNWLALGQAYAKPRLHPRSWMSIPYTNPPLTQITH